ncbi:MAG: hypothetical protein Fur0037_17840 [Planctomycetota bacterium]
MGQLEKYGLYVLCLVIFLILGVALWGEPTPVHADGKTAGGAMLNVQGGDPGSLGSTGSRPVKTVVVSADDDLMRKLIQQKAPSRKDPAKTNPKEASPPPSPAVENEPPAPPPPATRTYKVVSGDILGTIAQKQLGSARYVDEILKLNPGLDPKNLKIGTEIVLPARASAASKPAPGPAAPGSKRYTIRDGDTLEAISERLFRTKTRVEDIRKLNPGLDPRRLRIGKTILVPAR